MRMDKRGAEGYMIGLDLNESRLKICKLHKVYDDVILADVAHLPLKDKTVNLTLSSEVIEHLPKERGWLLLNEVERITNERAILTTPNNPRVNKCCEGSIATADVHKSAWSPKDFEPKGYTVYGIGVKARGPPRNLIFQAAKLLLFTPLSFFLPSLGELLIAIKTFDD